MRLWRTYKLHVNLVAYMHVGNHSRIRSKTANMLEKWRYPASLVRLFLELVFQHYITRSQYTVTAIMNNHERATFDSGLIAKRRPD